MFTRPRGLVPALDMTDEADLDDLVKATSDLPFIQGYKVGMAPGLALSLRRVTAIIRKHSELPIIYDHQKFGTDVPEIAAGSAMDVFKDAGLSAVIIFPQAGKRTLAATVEALKAAGINAIVGGEMTHPGYLESEGGYIADNAPARMYDDATSLGVEYYVVPGTKVTKMLAYKERISSRIVRPKFLFPGIGRGQGGDIVDAFRQVAPLEAYAIIGRGISAEGNRHTAAQRLWHAVEAAGLAQ